MDIYYKNKVESIGRRIVDFFLEEKRLVELKATTQLKDTHLAQILNYLRAAKIEIGLLINFGEKGLQFKRLVLSTNQ
jgi:GxxExxY protein